MLGLLILGYRFPLPWGVAAVAVGLPVAGYIVFSIGAWKVPASWRTQYMVTVLVLNAGLLAATITAVAGLIRPIPLIGIIAGVGALTWAPIRRAVTESRRGAED